MEHSFHFYPPINSTTISQPTNFSFYGFQSESDTTQITPELWISHSSSPEQQQEWEAISFNKLNDQTQLWHTTIQLKPNSLYSFTYRLKLKKTTTEETIIWIAKPTQDAHIQTTANNNNNNNNTFIQHLLKTLSNNTIQYNNNNQQTIQHNRLTLKPTAIHHHQNAQLHPIPLPTSQDHDHHYILAFQRTKPTWFTPQPLRNLSEIPETLDTQLLIIADTQQLAIILPISTQTHSSSIRATPASPLTISTQFNTTTPEPKPELVLITGPTSELRRMIIELLPHQLHPDQAATVLPPPQPKGMGYCTWNSLGPKYTLSQVIAILDSFRVHRILPALDRLLLDDGWQDLNGNRLAGWGAPQSWLDIPLPHPSTLTEAVKAIKNYPGSPIQLVGVWITITGYWGGIDPHSELMHSYDLQKWAIRPSSSHSPSPPGDDDLCWLLPSRARLRSFWDSYFGFLRAAGVDFVKMDNQAGLDRLLFCETDPSEDPHTYRSTLLDLVDELMSVHFVQQPASEENVIHSMAHSPSIWFREDRKDGLHGLSCKKKKVMRTSDDFFPDLKTPNGHRWHILSNAFVSILAQGRGYIPDFDMTMSRHEWAGYHGCFRAFSSAPIYLTDRLGQHDLALCERLTAILKADPSRRAVVQPSDGSAGAVLSSCALGKPALELSDPASPWGLLKVSLAVPYSSGALIGIWNVKQDDSCSSTKAIDVLTARDIAESMMDLRSLASLQKDGPVESKKVDLALVSLHQPEDSPLPIIRRLELLRDFDLEAERHLPQSSSPPIVECVLDGRPESAFEVWRIASFLDLPPPPILPKGSQTTEDIRIQVASLGLLDQFVGLCAVTTTTSPTSSSVVNQPLSSSGSDQPAVGQQRRPSETETVDERDGTEDGGLVDFVATILRRPGSLKKTQRLLSAILGRIVRHPLRSIVFELRSLAKLGWNWLVSIFFYFFFSPLSSSSSPSGSSSSIQKAHRPGHHRLSSDTPSAHGPQLPSTTTKTSSGSVDDQPEGVRFRSLFNGPLGFLICLTRPPSHSNHHHHNSSSSSSSSSSLSALIQLRVNGHLVPLDQDGIDGSLHPHHLTVDMVPIPHRSSFSTGTDPDARIDQSLFFVTIDPAGLDFGPNSSAPVLELGSSGPSAQPRSPHPSLSGHYWEISVHRKKAGS
ncbi:hypothetical protein PGT21_020494 [Puccinia graminis f. sp. tritici]|uniref:Uncharacterized protein n=1 Tax=Puccinia graminis f. sp. tritici TaxID=56615 RepID=A0A5B0R1S2_PUCGR|nr:hypothetical protein PGT21_020494 [Puccinia graminis f. sp. tritici]